MKKLRRTKQIIWTFILISFLLYVSQKSGYVLTICQYIPYPNILYYCVITIGLITCFFLLPQQQKTQKSYVLVIIVCLITCFLICYDFFLLTGAKVTFKESPDGKHKLVFTEYDHMTTGECLVYEKNLIYMKQIGSFITSRTYPLYDGNYYRFEWNEDAVVLHPVSGKYSKVQTIRYTTTK